MTRLLLCVALLAPNAAADCLYQLTDVTVIDGDTIEADVNLGFDTWLRDQRIRLLGIDAPETRTRNAAEKARGYLSRDFLNERISNSSEIYLQTGKRQRDNFSRILGTIYVNGIDANQLMIDAGHAVEYRK